MIKHKEQYKKYNRSQQADNGSQDQVVCKIIQKHIFHYIKQISEGQDLSGNI